MKRKLLIYGICFAHFSVLASGQPTFTKYQPKAAQIVPTKAQGFFAGEVKLLSGPFMESQEAEGRILLSHDADRLLAPYLTASGVEPKQPVYLGWEINVLPGVGLGFYLSGISRKYMSTGNKEYADYMERTLFNHILSAQAYRNEGFKSLINQ